MELFIETEGYIYDITGLCSEISWTDELNNGAGYLEFSYLYDEDIGLIQRGAAVRLTDNDQKTGIFYGYVFKAAMDQDKVVKVKAYDNLRYCKAKDTIAIEGDTLNTLVTRLCNYVGLTEGENTSTSYVLPDNVCTDKTWLDIVYEGISDTLLGTEHYYCLRSEYGSICLRDMADLQLPLVLGDGSLAYEYSYSASIDDEFYNRIKLVSANESTGRVNVYSAHDAESIEKYGFLQYYEVLDKNADGARSKEKAQKLLRLYNRELETLSLSCLGDLSVRAGCSIYGSIADVKLERRLIVKRVSHRFLPVHTMSVEVMI